MRKYLQTDSSTFFCLSVLLGAIVSVFIPYQASAQTNLVADASDNVSTIFPGHLTMSLRTLLGKETIDDLSVRHAWTENLQFNFESAYTDGPIQFGMDVSPFVMLKMAASDNAGNMAHIDPDGKPGDERAWAYLGKYLFKVKAGDTVLKHGLQQVVNPYLESNDLRGLPSSFRGTSVQSRLTSMANFDVGSFDAYKGRGHTELHQLTTAYSGTRFKRLDYVGANWTYAPDAELIVYLAKALDVWNQSFVSNTKTWGETNGPKWTATTNLYRSQSSGKQLGGEINSKAFSLALSVQGTQAEIKMAYQKNQSEQFFDYVKDAWGIWLANAYAIDFNAPHEESLRFTASFSEKMFGLAGLKVNLWTTFGRGADATVMAVKNQGQSDARHSLYWKNGRPVNGKHHDIGTAVNYRVPTGDFKDTVVGLILVRHRSTRFYADNSFGGFRFSVDMPMKLF